MHVNRLLDYQTPDYKTLIPMLIVITLILLFGTALTLSVLRLARPQFRFAWLTALAAAFLAWLTILFWRASLPFSISLPAWMSPELLPASPVFSADQASWPYALALVTLTMATLLTATAREGFPNSLTGPAALTVCGLGLLAVTAGNPLSLALVWAALDLAELIIVLRAVHDRLTSERAVIAFSVHTAGTILLLLAQAMESGSAGPGDFSLINPQASWLLLLAAGLRLGVLPVHLPYLPELPLGRGLGTMLRLTLASASLVLLSRAPASGTPLLIAGLLLLLAAAAAVYGSWMWLRAPDGFAGRPFWIIGLGALAVSAALRGSPAGAAAWGLALILAGGAMFLSSIQGAWLSRMLFVAAWGISALPLSLTAAGWTGSLGLLDVILLPLIVAQALLMAGFVRHALRPAARTSLDAQPAWARSVYPVGIFILLVVQIMLSLWGWDGALQIGLWPAGVAASLVSLGLLWAVPRFAALNPIPAHWLRPTSPSGLDRAYQNLWGIYRWFGGLSQTISDILEGEAGIMWSLLFLILFVVLLIQRKP